MNCLSSCGQKCAWSTRHLGVMGISVTGDITDSYLCGEPELAAMSRAALRVSFSCGSWSCTVKNDINSKAKWCGGMFCLHDWAA